MLRHRIVPSFAALAEEVTADMILDRLLPAVAVPQPPPPIRRSRRSGAMSLAALARPRSAARPGPGARPTPEALLRALDLTVGRRIRGLVPGEYRAHDLGGGTELAQVRPYEPGDDVRRIDWNVTARTTIPHVRVHVPERALTAWLLLDVSPSMTFGTADRRKADVAEGVAVAIGHLATQRGNRLGIVTFGGSRDRRVPPAAGRTACSDSCSPSPRATVEEGVGVASPAEALRSSPSGRAAGRARRPRLRLPWPA